MKLAALTVWLALVSIAGFSLGQHEKGANPISGGTEKLPACCARVETIEQQIVAAALRHGISPSRALARAWNESKYQDIDSACCRGIFQLHRRYFAAMPLGQHIEVAVGHLAKLMRQYGTAAERVYTAGHL